MKKLIICPVCKGRGTTNVLGEIDENGHFVVQRYHQGRTKIVGGPFVVVCGSCGEPIYIRIVKKGIHAGFHYWKHGIHWSESCQGFIRA